MVLTTRNARAWFTSQPAMTSNSRERGQCLALKLSDACGLRRRSREVLVKAGCDVHQALAFRVVSTSISRHGAARGTRWADSRPYPKRRLKKIHTLIYKSPGTQHDLWWSPVNLEMSMVVSAVSDIMGSESHWPIVLIIAMMTRKCIEK